MYVPLNIKQKSIIKDIKLIINKYINVFLFLSIIDNTIIINNEKLNKS